MSRRALRFWIIVSAIFALSGAFMHSLFVMGWNMMWLGIYVYAYNAFEEKDK